MKTRTSNKTKSSKKKKFKKRKRRFTKSQRKQVKDNQIKDLSKEAKTDDNIQFHDFRDKEFLKKKFMEKTLKVEKEYCKERSDRDKIIYELKSKIKSSEEKYRKEESMHLTVLKRMSFDNVLLKRRLNNVEQQLQKKLAKYERFDQLEQQIEKGINNIAILKQERTT